MTEQKRAPGGIDTTTPSVARIYDYLLRGKNNFAGGQASSQLHVRSLPDVLRFFDGFELVEPGLTWITQWRPEPGTAPAGRAHSMRGAVGRKP